MFTGRDFVFSVSRGFVRELQAPLLVLTGTDAFHPMGAFSHARAVESFRRRLVYFFMKITVEI
jgi:hypothetical protein